MAAELRWEGSCGRVGADLVDPGGRW